jgi:peptidyl-tRNA hydrolase, PTH1 family
MKTMLITFSEGCAWMKSGELFIIAGLGNPGRSYSGTRHNAGFEVIDIISEKYGIKLTKLKHKAWTGEGYICGVRVLLVKPGTYMNLVGESIRDIVQWHGFGKGSGYAGFDHLIVIYDDIDLSKGQVRIRPGGSAGTHNGMRSVIYNLQTDEFPRVRIGIGKPPEGWELSDYVLGRFKKDEYKAISEGLQTAAKSVVTIVTEGISAAMNKYNSSTGTTGSETC